MTSNEKDNLENENMEAQEETNEKINENDEINTDLQRMRGWCRAGRMSK